jgi:predicted permease
MIRNFIITTFRNFYRYFTYTSINLIGLSVGLSAAIFIFVWIMDELRYDKSYQDHERIYAGMINYHYSNGTIETGRSAPGPLTKALMEEVPEVEFAGRTSWGANLLLRHEQNSMIQNGLWADPEIIRIFSLQVVKGNVQNPMPDNNSIVLTESLAKKFFPKEDALGKVFRVEEKYDMKVTAIVKDQPDNVSLRFEYLLPYEVFYKTRPWMAEWGNINDLAYVKLHKDATPEAVNKKLEGFIQKKCPDCDTHLWLQRYEDLRLHSRYSNGVVVGGRIEYVQIFSIVGIFILVIACINFMNLATARAATRSREVGVRKAIGAQRTSLVVQFMMESVLLSFAGLIIALAMVQILLPVFNLITDKNIRLQFNDPVFSLGLVSVTLLTGLLSGSYPAFFLSSFRPALVLKGNSQSVLTGASLRKVLVVFQFTLSVILIIGSIVVYQQVQFIHTRNLGFDRQNVITFETRDSTAKNMETFKAEVLKNPAIASITFSGHSPFAIGSMTTGVTWPNKPDGATIPFKLVGCDKDFITTIKMEIIAGRDFQDNVSDSTNYIINQAAAEVIGYDDPVGQPLNLWQNPSGKIIGVVKDFHNTSFNNAIEPTIIMCRPDQTWTGFARIENNAIPQAIAHLESVQKKYDPAYPFEYSFLDEQFHQMYKTESIIGNISLYFTVVAVFISCLGLFGLASFTAARRVKEIGVRKILGASVSNLISLLCTDFARLIIVSLIIACPLAYYLMNMFLQKYQYHTDLTWGIFAVTTLLVLCIALFTVIFQAAKAALANPVKALRNE